VQAPFQTAEPAASASGEPSGAPSTGSSTGSAGDAEKGPVPTTPPTPGG
jgi:hypothetical protein